MSVTGIITEGALGGITDKVSEGWLREYFASTTSTTREVMLLDSAIRSEINLSSGFSITLSKDSTINQTATIASVISLEGS